MAPVRPRTTQRLLAALVLTLFCALPAQALRLVNYNLLNYPGTTAATRDPLYRTILQPLAPDLVVVEEITSDAGCNSFLANLNTLEPGQWSRVTFQDGGDTDSHLFYKSSKVQFLGQWAFYPNAANLLRYVHVYRVKPVGYTTDATEIRIYSVHLKASTGFEAQRLAEATGIRDTLNALPPNVHAIVCGDFNFYTGLEPGMQKFVENQANNRGRLYDPLGLQSVSWQDNTSMQYAWTQSPCKTGDTGCGPGAATGGMDDRFDLILPTESFRDGVGIELVTGSYIAVGNDGLHHNNSIQDPPTIPEGATYAAALHAVSDHLPVRIDIRLPALLQASSSPIAFGRVLVGATVGTTLNVGNAAPSPGETLTYTYSAPAGFSAPAGTRSATAGATNSDAISLDTSSPAVRSGTLALSSNSIESASRSIAVSATVVAHAVASLDSLVTVTTDSLDLGTQPAASFAPLSVRVHNRGGASALQSALVLSGATITGGAGRFSVSGTLPRTIGGSGASFTVAFDATGATVDSTYRATLVFTGSDEALPGAQAATPLTLQLRARRQSEAVTGTDGLPPRATALFAPAPNPVADHTALRFDLAHGGRVRLEAFDAAGRRVATLLDGELAPGRHQATWSGLHTNGVPLGSGLYFVRLTAPGIAPASVRLVVVRD